MVDADGGLAVGLLAQRPAVLALDPDGMPPLLGEGGVVDDEDGLGVGEALGHACAVASPDGLLVPVGLVDEVLEALVGVLDAELRRLVDAADQGLDALALAVLEQAAEIDERPIGLAGQGEVGSEAVGVGIEPGEDTGGSAGVKVRFIRPAEQGRNSLSRCSYGVVLKAGSSYGTRIVPKIRSKIASADIPSASAS